VHPDAHGFRRGDHHVLLNDRDGEATCFAFDGQRLWKTHALARGQGGDREWNRRHTDTPPGLYASGAIYRDWEADREARDDRTRNAFGWVSIALIGLEDQERRFQRSGLMVHGGGSGLGWQLAWAPYQQLLPTWGCVRMHNHDLQHRVLPLFRSGRVFWSVYQEA
jgi:hypothetical protein